MITIACKSFRVHHEAESVVLEIEFARPLNLVPQLLSKSEVAQRLAISERKVETMVNLGRLPAVRVDGCVRFKEVDILKLIAEDSGTAPRAIVSPLPARGNNLC